MDPLLLGGIFYTGISVITVGGAMLLNSNPMPEHERMARSLGSPNGPTTAEFVQEFREWNKATKSWVHFEETTEYGLAS